MKDKTTKFKKGDKVKVRKGLKAEEYYNGCRFDKDMNEYRGKTFTIEEAYIFEGEDRYLLKDAKGYRYSNDMLEPFEFTKSDLQVGDIITLRNGKKGEWDGERFEVERHCHLEDHHIENDLTNNGRCGDELDIIKVERHQVVFERKEEILDKQEKEYLSNVIKPFRDSIIYIEKHKGCEKDFIYIQLNGDHTSLPYFKEGTMYNGMEADKEYSLDELGL